jgi:predicted N-acetyltransferase YhbS
MGKIFPLSEKPSCLDKAIALIERSFQYKAPYKFEIDFAPLIDKSNLANCFVLLGESEEVLAHVGVKERIVHGTRICLLGGIAVEENHRGQGLFNELFSHVMAEKRDECAFFVLWSDQEKLYKRFGFSLCGMQFELSQSEGKKDFKKGTFADIKTFYPHFERLYLTPERDWGSIEKITSAEIYSNGEGYFVLGKGQDLTGVIHEYGTNGDLPSFLESIRSYGKVWMGKPFVETEAHFYQYMIAPGDTRLFGAFIHDYTSAAAKLREINVMKQEVFFDFNGETLVLEVEEFLRGVFGPGTFEEFGDPRPLFFSGLDSI